MRQAFTRRAALAAACLLIVSAVMLAAPALAAAATISGTVTGPTGALLEGVLVQQYWDSGVGIHWVGLDYTDPSGDYGFTGLGAGTYYLDFTDYTHGLQGELWDDGYFQYDPITVTDAQDFIADVTLEAAGSIEGTVTADGGAASAVTVYLIDAEYGSIRDLVLTASNGHYSFPSVHPIDWKVRFSAPARYITEYYNDQPDLGSAGLVTVGSGQAVSGIDAELDAGGSISGNVSDSDGSVENADVMLFRKDGLSYSLLFEDFSDASGDYSFAGLSPGEYIVRLTHVTHLSEYYDDVSDQESAHIFTVTGDESYTDVDGVLVKAGSISGTITEYGTGSPLIALVQTLRRNDGGFWSYENAYWSGFDGDYTVGTLRSGTYRIVAYPQWSDPARVSQYWPSGYDLADGQDVPVAVAEDVVDKDIQLPLTSVVGGRVLDGSGSELEGAYLALHRMGSDGGWAESWGLSTNVDGEYSFGRGGTAIPSGTYVLVAFDPDGDWAGEFYQDSYGWSTATRISVGTSETVVLDDLQLEEWGHLTGVVRDAATKAGIPAWVGAYLKDGEDWVYKEAYETAPDGSYDVEVGTGEYRLHAFDESGTYDDGWYGGTRSVSAESIEATVAETIAGLDIELEPAACFEGSVTDTVTGDPIVDVIVIDLYHWEDEGVWYYMNGAVTDTDGDYRLGPALAGRHKLLFLDASLDHAFQWFRDAPGPASAEIIYVTEPRAYRADARLLPAGSISGTVRGPDGPVSGANVVAVSLEDQAWTIGTATDVDGTYTIPGLPEGDHTVAFLYQPGLITRLIGSEYASELYDDTYDWEDATPVHVSAGERTASIDATLEAGYTIHGRVALEDGPAAEGCVVLGQNDCNPLDSRVAIVQADGTYRLTGLAPGAWRIGFDDATLISSVSISGVGPLGGLGAPEHYDDRPSWASAEPIVVGPGEPDRSIDATLCVGGTLTGTVLDPDGRPLDDDEIGVALYVYDSEAGWVEVEADQPLVAAGASGSAPTTNWARGPLYPGKYKVLYRDWEGDWGDTWAGGTPSMTGAAVVTVTNRGAATVPTTRMRYRDSYITLSRGSATIRYGGTTLLTGTLRNGAGRNLPGRAVTLVQSPNGRWGWTYVTSGRTDWAGRLRTWVRPRSNTYYRLLFAGDGLYPYCSGTTAVSVKARLTAPDILGHVHPGSSFSISGKLNPRHREGSYGARLYFYRRESGRWVLRKTAAAKLKDLNAHTSRYGVRTKVSKRGRWRVRAKHQDANHAPTYSGWTYFTCR